MHCNKTVLANTIEFYVSCWQELVILWLFDYTSYLIDRGYQIFVGIHENKLFDFKDKLWDVVYKCVFLKTN